MFSKNFCRHAHFIISYLSMRVRFAGCFSVDELTAANVAVMHVASCRSCVRR